ncbi:unnamed protein product [Clonostachys rosea f. rosea IK726]|uniref:Uncharacterized protein n=2 Tax=Bionectria ochroleuca TaxID=29856 RepID=A0A0B7JTK1_BIOOC|nr:unnamed protein product [Clonostachys rosea f. rosea IK726]
MAAELKQGRRRTNSSAVPIGRNGHARGASVQVQPKSSHTSDEFLRPFLTPGFDPASFLNSTLPPLQRSAPTSTESSGVAELSTQAQALINQLNAHTSRLSTTLTSLTDDILRSGSRLAYEVELLRGETLSLTETMHDTLQEDIEKFVPGGLKAAREERKDGASDDGRGSPTSETAEEEADIVEDAGDPPYVKQLQTLTLVRERLEAVIRTFGDAMEFVFPPSELSVSSSFLSVSAPEPGSQQQSSEDKGQEVLRKLREEISNLLLRSEDPVDGIAKAAERIEELKLLTTVWKGTSEEHGRNKFIESLAKMVEDRHRELMRDMEPGTRKDGKLEGSRTRKGSVTRDAAVTGESKPMPGGFGLLTQLQRLRNGI